MIPDADIVIVGAGCAGLSLAAALTVARVPGRVLLLEPRTDYVRDRTWCFWNTEEHPFTPAISHSWNSWRVSDAGRDALQSSRHYRYCHIAGDSFYRLALQRIEREPQQELCLGVEVHSVEALPDGQAAVETSAGRVLAGQVFDSRLSDRKAAPTLLQRFTGWHVRTAEHCFEPETVELMRFLPSDTPGRTRFLYLLPFSTTEALVEMTYLDDPRLPEPAYEADLAAWLGEQAHQWETLYTEHGSLPMQPARAAAAEGGNTHRIGIAGGRLKPSSGYGFLRIQRHSRRIAEALRDGLPVPRGAEPRLYSVMDAIFLHAVERAPASIPDLFLRLFARATPDALVRFLSEASAPGEMLRVALSLPMLPMLRAALTAGAAH